ncbi:MAG: VOC family protein [Leptolyngbya sp. SIO3F4]|nr:VOC family protein [Leptolyngbya sp. SIO3F4]
MFILTKVGAPDADKLVEFGLVEGAPNTHPGQGTANRRFFFENAMLELLWVADAEESQASDLSVLSRRNQGGSPFGVCLRPVGQSPKETPFSGWRYTPDYLPAPLYIWVGQNSENLSEPFMFYLNFAKKKSSAPVQSRNLQTVSRLTIVGCQEPMSDVLTRTMQQTQRIEFLPGATPLMELGFNGESQGQTMDFRPHLPLRLCW